MLLSCGLLLQEQLIDIHVPPCYMVSSYSRGDPLLPLRKKSTSRENSPGSSNGSSRGILKNKDFHAGTLGGILQKKKPTVEVIMKPACL